MNRIGKILIVLKTGPILGFSYFTVLNICKQQSSRAILGVTIAKIILWLSSKSLPQFFQVGPINDSYNFLCVLLLFKSALGGFWTPMQNSRHRPWKIKRTAHLIQLPCVFQKTYLLNNIHFRWRNGIHMHPLICTCRWEPLCWFSPTKLHFKIFCTASYTIIMRLNKKVVHVIYSLLSWTITFNQSIGITGIADCLSLFKFPAVSHSPLLSIIFWAPNDKMSPGLGHLTACGI